MRIGLWLFEKVWIAAVKVSRKTGDCKKPVRKTGSAYGILKKI